MRRGLAIAAVLAAGCGEVEGAADAGCAALYDPGPLTLARADALAPGVREGLAISTTRIWGDCRPRASGVAPRDACGESLCLRSRAALRVLLVPTNLSVPLDPACPDGPRAAAAATRAVAEVETSAEGEAVVALAPGSYQPFVIAADGCARCGDPGEGVCRVTVEEGRLALADLVLDEAAR